MTPKKRSTKKKVLAASTTEDKTTFITISDDVSLLPEGLEHLAGKMKMASVVENGFAIQMIASRSMAGNANRACIIPREAVLSCS